MWERYTPYLILTAYPIHGLCNRLRGLASGAILARYLGYRFNVYWEIDEEMPVHFLDLFEAPPMIFTPVLPHAAGRFGSTLELMGPWIQRRPRIRDLGPGVQASIELDFPRPEPIILTTYHNLKPAGMTDDEFMREKRSFLASLRPLPHIREDIDTVRSCFGTHTVGVHVRGTDTAFFWKGRQLPAHELYFAQMDACLAERPDTVFFLSSDTDEVVEAATRRYGRRITSMHSTLKRPRADRFALEGQEEAVIDLFSLAATERLIGTHGSTFSYEAAAFHGIPFDGIAGESRRSGSG